MKKKTVARGDGDALAAGSRTAASDASDSAATAKAWAEADRIADVLVDAMQAELARMRATDDLHPDQILAGLFLACMALFVTMPEKKPRTLEAAIEAIHACLVDLRDNGMITP